MARQAAQHKDLDYYMKLPYAIELRQYEDGAWFARIPELRGCMTEADTLEEAMDMIRDAQREWIAACLDDGTPIPEPREARAYSGQFRARLPRSLHRQLAELAEQEGTSLNQIVVSLLSGALGSRAASSRQRAKARSRT
ncbi:MAG: toxin-antitoxin system HicB family antitoxin [Armatimonadota bacterium]|jgi:antitoxin HicB